MVWQLMFSIVNEIRIPTFQFSGIPLLPEASGGAATYTENDKLICSYDLRLLADFYESRIPDFIYDGKHQLPDHYEAPARK